jgi:hypothetical protein
MPEIRFSVTEKLDDLIARYSGETGVTKADYIKSLIIADIRKSMQRRREK